MNRQALIGPVLTRLSHRERIDWHDHALHQLIYPSSGVLHVSTTEGSWIVPPQRAVWLPAEVAHSHQAYGATQMRTLAIEPGTNPLQLTRPTVLRVSNLLRELIVALTDDRQLSDDERADLLRVALHQLEPATGLRLHLPAPVDDRLRDVVAILVEDPGDQRSLAALGRSVGVGERTLSRLFRRDTGMTFPQWRALLRLHHSLTLLAAGHSVTSAAISCGYQNPSSFIAAFGQTFGTTPTAYHRQLSAPS